MSAKTTLWAAGLGAGAMYFFDPHYGRRRRAMVRDRVNAMTNDLNQSLDLATRDARNRAEGLWHEARSLVSGSGAIADDRLHARIRTRLGRLVSHPKAIEVDVRDHDVTLRGPILAEEVDELIEAVRAMPGVGRVENELEVHHDPGEVVALQGRGHRHGSGGDSPPGTRLLSVGLGSLAMFACWLRPSLTNIVLGTIGFGVVVNAAACSTARGTARETVLSR